MCTLLSLILTLCYDHVCMCACTGTAKTGQADAPAPPPAMGDSGAGPSNSAEGGEIASLQAREHRKEPEPGRLVTQKK